MIVAKIVGSVVTDKIDQKFFGGALKKVSPYAQNALFAYRIIKAVRSVKKANAAGLAAELVDAIAAAAPVDKGHLRDSVRFEPNENGGRVVAGGTPETMKPFKGGTFDEALGIEYGTTKRAAQPYYWPTMRRYEKKIEKSLGGAIEQEFG